MDRREPKSHYVGMKNEHAVALGRLKRGIAERKTARKQASSRANVAKATAARVAQHAAKSAPTITVSTIH